MFLYLWWFLLVNFANFAQKSSSYPTTRGRGSVSSRVKVWTSWRAVCTMWPSMALIPSGAFRLRLGQKRWESPGFQWNFGDLSQMVSLSSGSASVVAGDLMISDGDWSLKHGVFTRWEFHRSSCRGRMRHGGMAPTFQALWALAPAVSQWGSYLKWSRTSGRVRPGSSKDLLGRLGLGCWSHHHINMGNVTKNERGKWHELSIWMKLIMSDVTGMLVNVGNHPTFWPQVSAILGLGKYCNLAGYNAGQYKKDWVSERLSPGRTWPAPNWLHWGYPHRAPNHHS